MSDVPNNPLAGTPRRDGDLRSAEGRDARAVPSATTGRSRTSRRLPSAAFGREAAGKPGAGAAGGPRLRTAIAGRRIPVRRRESLADLLSTRHCALEGADWLITGEGRTDVQTLLGKTPHVVAQRARRQGVPATLLSGGVDRAALSQLSKTFAGCFSLVFGPVTLEQAIAESAGLLADSAEQLRASGRVARR